MHGVISHFWTCLRREDPIELLTSRLHTQLRLENLQGHMIGKCNNQENYNNNNTGLETVRMLPPFLTSRKSISERRIAIRIRHVR